MEQTVINIEKQFSKYPAGRYKADGPYSGERFRDDFLLPALKTQGGRVVVELDGARGYGSSFLEEAFGGLVRAGFTAEQLLDRLHLQSQDVSLLDEIREYILEQSKVH